MKKIFLVLCLFFLVGCFHSEDPVSLEVGIEDFENLDYDYYTELEDVTSGKVRGIVTNGMATGEAKATYVDGQYYMIATFEDLPDPVGTDFYEGWIVRTGISFDVLSSGKAEKVDGVYTNIYSSNQDLTDHTFYVLTVEPDDGNPAPADHILEGTLS